MRNIIYSCLSKSDPTYVEALEMFEMESDNYVKNFKVNGVLHEKEREYFDFIIKSFQGSGVTPSQQLFCDMFPELKSQFADTSDIIEIKSSDMRVYIFNLVDARVNEYVSKRIGERNIKVRTEGITTEISSEFDRLQKLSNRNKAKDIDISISGKDNYSSLKLRPLGMVTGIKAIDDKIGGMNEGTMSVIAGFTSQFKCVSENERVLTSKGLLMMKEIYQAGVDSGLMVQSEYGMRRLVAVHDEGVKSSYIIHVGGIPIETSPVHKFRVLTDNGLEWIEAKSLKVGDRVVQSLKDSCHVGESDDIDFWRLYGQLCGDGYACGTRTSNYLILCGLPDNLRQMDSERLFQKFFKSYRVYIDDDDDVVEGHSPLMYIRTTLQRALRPELWNFLGKKARTKEFPEDLFYKSRGCWEAFILGLYETDGCSGNNLGFTMSNRGFLIGVSRLLSAMGISSI